MFIVHKFICQEAVMYARQPKRHKTTHVLFVVVLVDVVLVVVVVYAFFASFYPYVY
jgi:uncharacterized membrane protein YsdA (DUF1294 family)